VVIGNAPPSGDFDRRLSLFVEGLRGTGLRLTHQRLEVAREIACNVTHPDVEAIFRGVRQRVPTISLDTVYRTLGALERVGLVHRVMALEGPTRYDPNVAPHHHFICTKCGLIRDIDGSPCEGLRVSESVAELGTVESITVQLRGLCKRCREERAD
jgi:Fur family transcriptional regulator, peroxide stress response regulator